MNHVVTLFALSLLGADPAEPTPGPVAMPEVAKPRTPNEPEPHATWELRLPGAIRIGLENDEITRLIVYPTSSPTMSIVVSGLPIDGLANASVTARDEDAVWRLKAAVMAKVSSIEQQYWELVARHVKVRETRKAVQTIEEAIKREESERLVNCHGGIADIAEARQRLDQFRLDLVTRTSEMIAAERRLRSLLGLPDEDDRRIFPTSTPPSDADTPDWQSCVAQMMEHRPEIVLQRRLVDQALVRLSIARNDLPTEAVGVKVPVSRYPLANVRQSQYMLIQQHDLQAKVVQEASRSLTRLIAEVNVNQRKHHDNVLVRENAAKRLDANRAYFEEGRIPIDRYLDTIARSADAVSEEARSMAAYQSSLVAIEEAKGTLLQSRKIFVCDPPRPRPSQALTHAASPTR